MSHEKPSLAPADVLDERMLPPKPEIAKHGETFAIDPLKSIGKLSEIGLEDRKDLIRAGRIVFGAGTSHAVEIVTHLNSSGEPMGYYLVGMRLEVGKDQSEDRYVPSSNFIPISAGLRLGRAQGLLRNDRSPVEVSVDAAMLGFGNELASTISREQLEFSIDRSGIKVTNIAQESPEDPRIGRVEYTVAPEEDLDITLKKAPVRNLAELGPKIELPSPEEQAAKQKAEVDAAQRAVEAAHQMLHSSEPGEMPSKEVAPLSARATEIARQTEGLKNGNAEVRQVVVKLDVEPKEDAEAPTQESEKTVQDKIREACASPDALLLALKDPEVPLELKKSVNDLVAAYREKTVAEATSKAWDETVVPQLRKIEGSNVVDMSYELQGVIDNLSSKEKSLRMGLNNLQEALHAKDVEFVVDALVKLKNTSGELLHDMGNGSLLKGLSDIMGDTRVSVLRTVFGEEEIAYIKQKLSRKTGPPEPEEIQELYGAHGTDIINGLEGLRVAESSLRAQADEASPNWRRRRDNLDGLFTQISRLTYDWS